MKELTGTQRARKCMGMTQTHAAAIVGVSIPKYIDLERNPQTMTVGQFAQLYRELDDGAKLLMKGDLAAMGVE